jgi:hypothetical protein
MPEPQIVRSLAYLAGHTKDLPQMGSAGPDWWRLAAVGHVPTFQTVAITDAAADQPGPTICGSRIVGPFSVDLESLG